MQHGPLTPHHGQTVAGGAGSEVMAGNASRAYLAFENTSDTDMWVTLAPEEVPAVGVGFLVPASGGSLERDNTFCPTGPVRVFCASASKTFSAYEG